MPTHPGFDPAQIDAALDAAQRYAQSRRPQNLSHKTPLTNADDGHLKLSGGECISVTVSGGQVCLDLPLGIGNYCFPVPSIIPDGTAAQACLNICTSWGIPCGVEVTVSALGRQIFQKGFGCC